LVRLSRKALTRSCFKSKMVIINDSGRNRVNKPPKCNEKLKKKSLQRRNLKLPSKIGKESKLDQMH
jgi:hypothetical protein